MTLPKFMRMLFLFLSPLWAIRSLAAETVISGSDPRILYSDYVSLDVDAQTHRVRFDRLLDEEGKGYRWDSPGSRVKIRTDSRSVKGLINYTKDHISKTARNPIGLYGVDGSRQDGWIFGTTNQLIERPAEMVTVVFPASDDGAPHDYELIMPYGDSVEFIGFVIESSAKTEAPTARPAKRYAAYGDSITHGFTASRPDRCYPFLLAEAQGWQLINMGFGGRQSNASDGAVLGSLSADCITLFIGMNDWQQGRSPDVYRHNLRDMIRGIRDKQPTVPVFFLTPLWVSPNWKPPGEKFPLKEYTQTIRDLVEELLELDDRHVYLVNGSELIDHDERYFDQVLVHPNDAGFAQMAERLSSQINCALRARETTGGKHAEEHGHP